MNTKSLVIFSLGMLLTVDVFSQDKYIAITIDDLPFVGDSHYDPNNLKRKSQRFAKLISYLQEYNVPATGFVIAGSIEKGQMLLLQNFKDAGFILGNHTFSHKSVGQLGAQKYILDVAKADDILANLMAGGPKYFRYPYLAMGKGQDKEEVYNYLIANNYEIAPVTIDSKDFKFNEQLLSIPWRSRAAHLNSIKSRYLSYIWQQTLRAEKRSHETNEKQILLIHANLLNSHFLGDLLKMYKDHGYTFISLKEALNKNIASPTKFDTAL